MNETKTNEVIDHGARGHHPYSPSSLQARELSPCYAPRQQSTESAAEASRRGTLQHEAVEKVEDNDTLSDEEADAVARAVNMVDNAKALIQTKLYEGETIDDFQEEYLAIDDEKMGEWIGTTGGFPDRALVWRPKGYAPDERHAIIYDWKFGRYAVAKAQHNRQLHSYMLGLRHFLWKRSLRLRSCQGVFFSPHRNEEPNSYTFREETDPTVFDRIYGELVTIVHRSKKIDTAIEKRGFEGLSESELALVIPSPKCVFCGRLAKCPKIAEIAEKIALAAKPLEVPKGNIHGFDENDPEALRKAVVVGDIVSAWAKQRRARIVALAIEHPDDDRYVPEGYKLSSSYPRKVVDPKKLLALLTKKFGRKAVLEEITIPLTNFSKRLSEAAPRGEKTAAVEAFDAELEAANVVAKSTLPVVSLRMR